MSNGEHKWVTVFLEVALRAIRRVHLEYGIWAAGRQWKTGPGRPDHINVGPGIELADERAVCAALTQEFMVSPSLTGLWENEGKTDVRFFAISREQLYKWPEAKQRKMVDLLIEKYEQTSLGKFEVIKPRSLIEAKRARLWQIDLETGDVSAGSPVTQISAVIEDVARLKEEREAWEQEDKRVFLHLLVWGVYGDDSNHSLDHPLAFFQEVRKKSGARLDGPYVRWLPTKWDPPENVEESGHPIVRRSVWVALAEVDRPEE